MKTLETQVLKTATATGVKLAAPADRIGLGFGVAYPMDNLSLGHVPVPHNPEPEQVRSRQLSAMPARMRWQSVNGVVPPASSAGWFPGVSAVRFTSIAASLSGGSRGMRTAAIDRTRAVRRFADPSRTRVPGDSCFLDRLGRDCQSPDRSGDKRIATRGVSSTATAGK
jgi:hypothetical protein